MNRFNFVGPAAQTISAASALTTFTIGNMKREEQTEQLRQANEIDSKREQQEINANVDRQIYTEAKEYERATGDDATRYVNDNRERVQSQAKANIDRYGKYAGEIAQLGSTAVQDSINEYRSRNQAPDVKFNPQDLIDGGII